MSGKSHFQPICSQNMGLRPGFSDSVQNLAAEYFQHSSMKIMFIPKKRKFKIRRNERKMHRMNADNVIMISVTCAIFHVLNNTNETKLIYQSATKGEAFPSRSRNSKVNIYDCVSG